LALTSALQRTEFTDQLLSKLRECYAPGLTFNAAFAFWMNFLFEDYGLIFLSPNHPTLKKLVSPLFVGEIAGHPKTSQMV